MSDVKKGFKVVCNNCGVEINLGGMRVDEPDEHDNGKISVMVNVYEYVEIECTCGNKREVEK